jgi:flagellar biosynthesis protein FlhF
MADALAAVKRELGRDAVILHTRMYKVGSWFGLGGKQVVEITASDDVRVPRRGTAADGAHASAGAAATDASLLAAESPAVGMPVTGRVRAAAAYAAGTGRAGPGPSPKLQADPGGGEMNRTSELQPERKESSGVTPSDRLARGSSTPARDVARMALSSAGYAGGGTPGAAPADPIREELSAIRRMVSQVLQTSSRSGASVPGLRMPEALFRHYARLIENEVAQEVADSIVSAVRDELTPAELTDDEIVRLAVLRHLEALLPVDPSVSVPSRGPDGRPLTVALVGPTGVGKTTTIAKLAASYRLRHGRKVALITSDTYRIAAVDQLRTYANIIGVPLKVVHTPDEMRQACRSLSDADVVLIDTAGRSPGDAARLEELRGFVEAAEPHQVHLVLASTACEAAMMRTIERFAPLRANLVLFTKLDEAANLGVMVNVARRINARLSYVTTGQEVPDDIEPGRSDRLARLVLDGRMPR